MSALDPDFFTRARSDPGSPPSRHDGASASFVTPRSSGSSSGSSPGGSVVWQAPGSAPMTTGLNPHSYAESTAKKPPPHARVGALHFGGGTLRGGGLGGGLGGGHPPLTPTAVDSPALGSFPASGGYRPPWAASSDPLPGGGQRLSGGGSATTPRLFGSTADSLRAKTDAFLKRFRAGGRRQHGAGASRHAFPRPATMDSRSTEFGGGLRGGDCLSPGAAALVAETRFAPNPSGRARTLQVSLRDVQLAGACQLPLVKRHLDCFAAVLRVSPSGVRTRGEHAGLLGSAAAAANHCHARYDSHPLSSCIHKGAKDTATVQLGSTKLFCFPS